MSLLLCPQLMAASLSQLHGPKNPQCLLQRSPFLFPPASNHEVLLVLTLRLWSLFSALSLVLLFWFQISLSFTVNFSTSTCLPLQSPFCTISNTCLCICMRGTHNILGDPPHSKQDYKMAYQKLCKRKCKISGWEDGSFPPTLKLEQEKINWRQKLLKLPT